VAVSLGEAAHETVASVSSVGFGWTNVALGLASHGLKADR